jgi:hypothetical protein
LILAALFGCADAGDSLAGDELSGDRVRVGYPDCEGTLLELPVERNFIYTDRLRV